MNNPNPEYSVSDLYDRVQETIAANRNCQIVNNQSNSRSLTIDDAIIPFKTGASVTLYPNPVQDVLNISGDNVEKVTIYDMSGRQVATSRNTNTVSVSDLKKGTYLVRVLTAKGESTHKVMKK